MAICVTFLNVWFYFAVVFGAEKEAGGRGEAHEAEESSWRLHQDARGTFFSLQKNSVVTILDYCWIFLK